MMLLVACNTPPAIQRPREGAPPIAGGTPVRLESALPPPTLAAAGALLPSPTPVVPDPAPPSPSPDVFAVASPASSPGVAPVISGLQPAPGANLPAGDIVIGARISGTGDLTDVMAYVDGEAVPIEVGGPSIRVKTVSFVRTFASGTHEVRIQARDEHGQLGGYRWQFSIGAGRQPVTAPTARPTAPPAVAPPSGTGPAVVPPRTQIPIPTRIPAPQPTRATTAPPPPVQPVNPNATRTPPR